MQQRSKGRRFLNGLVAIVTVMALGVAVLSSDWCRNILADLLIHGPGSADYAYPLTGGLSLGRVSAHGRRISWHGDDCSEYEHERRKYGDRQGCCMVDADVTHLGWNDRFIVCYQADSPLAARRLSGWWIIDTREHRCYGPMNQIRFDSEGRDLGVADIEIRPVADWR